MRYLKPYKIFESVIATVGEVKQVCEDILLDLEDEGFDTNVVANNWSNTFPTNQLMSEEVRWVVITLRNKIKFDVRDIRGAKNRLTSYLNSIGLVENSSGFGGVRKINIQNPENFQFIGNAWEYAFSYEIPKSKLSESLSTGCPDTVDTIKDMFSDITDDWNIVSNIYYHDGTYAGKKQNEPAIYVDIEIDKRNLAGKQVDKFLDDVFEFAERVSSHCGLKDNYCMAGNNVKQKPSFTIDYRKEKILSEWSTSHGEYLQIYFTEE